MTGTLERIAQQIRAGEVDAAGEALTGVDTSNENAADVTFLQGYLQERTYDREQALSSYDKALEQDSEHVSAAFHRAVLCDQLGDDEEAIALFERCAGVDRPPIHALMNLAILYEDQGALAKAEACLKSVLAEHPEHRRAMLFLKSVQSAYTMVYDETTQREHEQRSAILDVPITDFELSVRSRNCLRQMGLRTLGDLLQSTEAELLAYKNFGETSLNEIKALLDQRGMKLGQTLQPTSNPVPAEALQPVTGEAAVHLQRPVSELELSVRSRKCLQRLGVGTLGELAEHSELELMTNKNFGETSLNEIKRQLTRFGLSLQR